MNAMAVLKDNRSRVECWQRRNLVTTSVPAPQGLIQLLFFVISLMMSRFLWYLLRWIVN